MVRFAMQHEIVDGTVRARTVARFRERGIRLPTFAELADPAKLSPKSLEALAAVDPDAAHPLNLMRVHWHNAEDRRSFAPVPGYVRVPASITGVASPIYLALGDRFPMIHAHKVLAAYACLVPWLVTGAFDPAEHRALWPSTGNYCRGGVAISRILGCRGVAILPEGMSQERFRWLEAWVTEPSDIVRTVGVESNVKEIYDKCAELEKDPKNVIFNQFCQFENYLVHQHVTGRALERVFLDAKATRPSLRLAAFVSATGSAGTIAAGDYLKEHQGARIVAAEALECPTMLYNGYGEHNIQGIGDKHIPLIHNVTNTDIVAAVSDKATDALGLLFSNEAGRAYLMESLGVSAAELAGFEHFGLSSLCNLLAAIKTSKLLGLGPDDAIVTVATDGAAMYRTEAEKTLATRFGGQFGRDEAKAVFDEYLAGVNTEDILALSARDRDRVFNLGYYTWVEQQGVSVEDFDRRRSQDFWHGLRASIPVWDELIDAFNRDAAGGAG